MKNILVQYQGGGYSGCYWEWNYFFLDANGVFCDITSSGDAGIETALQAKELLESGIQVGDHKWTIAAECGSFYIYDMTDDKAIKEFSRECNAVHVIGVLQWFEDNPQDGIEFFAQCSECGCQQTDMDELIVEADKILCSECHSMGICGCCSDYVGETNIIALHQVEADSEWMQECKAAIQELIDDGYGAVCHYCLDDKVEELDRANKDDMLWASRTTGVPDMFSAAMRWFWGTSPL